MTVTAGTVQQVFEGGGAKLDEIFFGRGGNAWDVLFNFSKVMENAFIMIKLLMFFPHPQ